MALVTTDTSPVPSEVSTMTNRTSLQSVLGISTVATGRTVAVRMSAGAVVAGVATLAAGAALVIDAVTLGAIAGTVGAHFSAMGAGFGPTRGMAAIGTIMALEARQTGPATEVVGAVTSRAGFRTIGDHVGAVGRGLVPADRMSTDAIVALGTTHIAPAALPGVAVASGAIAGRIGRHIGPVVGGL